MEEKQSLNLYVLYGLIDKTFNPNKYEPKELDIDLRNLESEGYVTYNGDLSNVKATERGKIAMKLILDELTASKQDEEH